MDENENSTASLNEDREKDDTYRLTLEGKGLSIEREVPEIMARRIVSLVLGGASPRGNEPHEEPDDYDEQAGGDFFKGTSSREGLGRDLKDYLREVRDEVAQNLKEVKREVERDIREVRDGPAWDIFNMGLDEILSGGKRPRRQERASRTYYDDEPSYSSPPLSIRKYLRESGAQRNPDKIVVIGAFLRDHLGWESFSRHDVRSQLRNSGARVPRNLTRDFKWAMSIGWIAEDPDTRGWYQVTEFGQEALDSKFSPDMRKATKLDTAEPPEQETEPVGEDRPEKEEAVPEFSEEDKS